MNVNTAAHVAGHALTLHAFPDLRDAEIGPVRMLPMQERRCNPDLVRDSRGVAYSWTKEVKKPEVTGGDDAFMPQYSPSSSGRQWVAYNLLFDVLGTIDKTMILRYEALMANPREGLERILAHADEPVTAESFAFLGDGYVDLGCDHTVAGNPMRFHQGRLDLRLDQAWTTKLPERDRKVVTAITWPLQLRYGYSKKDSK